jgi:hypothetical protein
MAGLTHGGAAAQAVNPLIVTGCDNNSRLWENPDFGWRRGVQNADNIYREREKGLFGVDKTRPA